MTRPIASRPPDKVSLHAPPTASSRAPALLLTVLLSTLACAGPAATGGTSDLADAFAANVQDASATDPGPGPDPAVPHDAAPPSAEDARPLAADDAPPAEDAPPPAPPPFHVFLFIGDGMGRSSELATSRYLHGHDAGLVWNGFPFRAWAATWDIGTYDYHAATGGRPAYGEGPIDPALGYDPAVAGAEPWLPGGVDAPAYLAARATDSGAAATAMATGLKTDAGNIAWAAGDPEDGALPSLTERVRAERGASVGVVTTVPFDHATPACFLAHTTGRSDYASIAQQIVYVARPEVLVGGGHPDWCATWFSADGLADLRTRDEWTLVERQTGVPGGAALVEAARTLAPGQLLFGLFGGTDGAFVTPTPVNAPGSPALERGVEDPSLSDAVLAAFTVLATNPHGFLLVVEQGDIDWANHGNALPRAIGAVASLDEAVRTAVALVDQPGDAVDRGNTLVIVTADHATGMPRYATSDFLAKGEVPVASADDAGAWVYAGGTVDYLSSGHGNELVTLAVWGDRAPDLFEPVTGREHPGTRIVENTSIFEAIAQFAGL